MPYPSESEPSLAPGEVDWLALVKQKVESLRFGVVQIVVHEGRVTQIERNEKLRLPADHESPPDKG